MGLQKRRWFNDGDQGKRKYLDQMKDVRERATKAMMRLNM